MKWFLISLAIGLAASDKLDRTYLPPPGAQFAGGILGSHDAPLEPPHRTPSGPGPMIGGEGSQPNFGINGEPVQFGDKILKVPVTTTSYAFSQTTTYPPGEGFETTVLPINPVTGLPIRLEQGNFPYGLSQGQAPNFGTNIQSGLAPQGPTSAPVTFDSPRDQFANQPLGQYTGQNVITPVGAPQIPGTIYTDQNQGQIQYPGGQANTEQQGFLTTGAPDSQRFDQYLGQNIVNPGGVVQIPGGNQGLGQYPGGQRVTGQQGLVPSTGSPINIQHVGKQQGVNYDGSQGLIPQGTYTRQPINVPNLSETQPTQTSYQNQQPINDGGIPSQYPNGNENNGLSVPTEYDNVHQPGSTPSTIPSLYNNGVSSTTPYSGVPSPTSAYSSVGPVYRPEKPQAAADRNAIIFNYENVRTPNGYSYSFDTSNGIHADESGIVDNGTKAQGSYSYIGDDGKVYSVIYTADENGFQPRGDHLPTPPPIPEAIQRVIEQAARDKAAGIMHDGSYDEAKYGDKQYQGTANHRRPQNQDTDVFGNKQFNGAQDDLIKPVAGIKDGDYNKGIAQNLINNNLPVTNTRKSSSKQQPARLPSNDATGGNNDQKVSEGNRRVSGAGVTPIRDYDENALPIQDGINRLNKYGTKKQGSSGGRPMSNGADLPFTATEDTNQNNAPVSKNRGSSGRRPVSGGVKDKMVSKYPGSNVDVGAADYSETERDEFDNNNGQDIDAVSPNILNGTGEKIGVVGSPGIGNQKSILNQRVKEDRRPDSTGNGNTQIKNDRPQGVSFTQKSTETPFLSDYLKNAIANQQENKQYNSGYQYKQPNTKFEPTERDTFPTRFSPQEGPSTESDHRRSEYVEGTTREPFMTPNVYSQNNKKNQATPNKYNQNDGNSQSTTRRPFTTIGVTSPSDNSYTDYDDGDNYATNQDIGDDRIESTRKPADNRVTSRPYSTTYTTSRPQNVSSGQRTRVNQKVAVTPGRGTENLETISPGYTYVPTTQMPSHNSRFGSTEIPRRMKPQQRRPLTTVPDSTIAVTTQSPAVTGQSDYKYQTTRPVSRYSNTNVGSDYPTTGSYPGLGSTATTPGVSTPQDFYTSTYGPQGYYSTTSVPPTAGYIQGSGSQTPSGTPESLLPSQDQSFHTGYHYETPKSGSFIPDNTGFFTPTRNSGVFPTSPTGTYQSTYQQGPTGFPSTTLGPISPGIHGTFSPFHSGTFAPETSPTGTYQGSNQNEPSTPDYATTIRYSTPGGKPVFRYPGSAGVQETTGYEYGPSRPTYSTTDPPSTIGTTPGSFIPSGTTGPSQDYSTNYRPGVQTTKDTFVGGPVDGFGRPITTERGGSHPGSGHPPQGTKGPGIIKGPNFGGTDQSTSYPGGFDQTRVIGEDFSGPKQPQRFDPITGYHY